MSRSRRLLAVSSLAALLAGCSGSPPGSRAEGAIAVVATTTHIGSIVEELGGDDIALTVLLAPGVEAHDFEMTPAAGAAVEEADPSDGVLEVVAIEAGPRFGLVGLAYRLRTGEVTDHPRAFHASCTTSEVVAPDDTDFNVDGELVTLGSARFTVQAGAFRLVVG